ncbi:MAG: hypothetical protein ACRCVI_02650 [Mycoplasmoidaceae bacterium]
MANNFEKVVLGFIKNQEKFNERQEGFNKEVRVFMKNQEKFNEKIEKKVSQLDSRVSKLEQGQSTRTKRTPKTPKKDKGKKEEKDDYYTNFSSLKNNKNSNQELTFNKKVNKNNQIIIATMNKKIAYAINLNNRLLFEMTDEVIKKYCKK